MSDTKADTTPRLDADPAGADPGRGAMTEGPFHPGELEAQRRAGAGAPKAFIRDWMPDQHREFFALLPFLVLGTSDATGWPVATILHGPPGFVSSPDPHRLRIAALPGPDDPVAALLHPGAEVGLLGIDLATRRRNRANGTLLPSGEGGLTVAVRESFGNCPKYIAVRHWRPAPADAAPPGPPERIPGLDAAARAVIARADAFFVATARGPRGTADVSHRGGPPGFVGIDGDVLTVPDFPGNRYFNTLGNLVLHPFAGLVFVDFGTGELLHVWGGVELDWNAAPGPAAERSWRLRVHAALRRPGALPLRWQP